MKNYTKQGTILASHAAGGLFANAQSFTLNQPVFVDKSQTTNIYVFELHPALQILLSAGTPGAALDSFSRHPPPKCHPGSRQAVNGRLEKWLLDLYRQRKMTWLYGPAGVGKSAIAQTFGELALKHNCLGAAFFSASALNALPTDPSRIIPTLAHQLTIRNENYKRLVTHRLAGDLSILNARLPDQFHELIVKPFKDLALSSTQDVTGAQSYVIILDGLDECENEAAQCDLIGLINDAAQMNDLPFIWLLCSRPESHIKYTFSQEEFVQSCDREELVIDDEARADVECFLRESFQEIQKCFAVTVKAGGVWPPKEMFDMISRAVSGYFVFASAVTRVVGDPIVGDPDSQLFVLMKMLRGLDNIEVNNPFEALDIFYFRVLSRVPEYLLLTAIQILGICARKEPSDERGILSAEQFRLFLQVEKGVFYPSLGKLHSIVRVPSHKDAQNEELSFFHKSFPDYLLKQRRSGKFFISDKRVKVLLGISSLRWYNYVVVCENRDLVKLDELNESQAMVKQWISGDEVYYDALMRLALLARPYYKTSISAVKETDTDFFDALCEFNFHLLTRSIDAPLVLSLMEFMHTWDWAKTPAGPQFIRTEVSETVDGKLLDHLSILTNGKPIPPIDIREPVVYHQGKPLPWKGPQPNTMGYIIIGRGIKSGLVCCYHKKNRLEAIVLNSIAPPTRQQMSQFRKWTEKMERPEFETKQGALTPTEMVGGQCQNQ